MAAERTAADHAIKSKRSLERKELGKAFALS
jgi:hypothetical protein